MTDDEAAQFAVLKLATEDGKFAIPLGSGFASRAEQEAFQRMQITGWISLIDVSPIAAGEPLLIYRVFLASAAAMHWFRSQH